MFFFNRYTQVIKVIKSVIPHAEPQAISSVDLEIGLVIMTDIRLYHSMYTNVPLDHCLVPALSMVLN